MKAFRKHLMISLTAVALGAGSIAAHAAGAGCEGQGPEHHHGASHEQFRERMKQRIEQRVEELHAKLKLNASQEAAWKDYIAAMRPDAPPPRPDRAEIDKLSAPERMEKHLALMKQRETKMEQRVAATRAFYAKLTPEQQRTFDQAFHAPRHRHGPHGPQSPHDPQGPSESR